MRNEYPVPAPDRIARQRSRMRRFALSVGLYVLSLVHVSVSVYLGYLPFWVLGVWSVLAALVNLSLFAVFRRGINLRYRDRDLTLAQMVVAIALALFAQVFSGPARAAHLVVLMVIIVVGCLRLSPRQLFWVGTLTALSYGATLPLAMWLDSERFDASLELFLWFSFLFYLPCIAVLAGYISRLRQRVLDSNAQLQQALQQVTQLAAQDELTGLHNRRYLTACLEQEKGRVDRGGRGFCICLLDLDHFKRINDGYGHAAGDAVLRQFAACAQALLRSMDLLGRYGGEEFLLLLPETRPDTARTCVARLQAELSRLEVSGLPPQLRVTLSAGIAYYREPESLDALIERADQALYLAKERGRDRIELAAPAAITLNA